MGAWPRAPLAMLHSALAVRQLREERGLSQEQLALNAQLDRSYVGGIERGERNPSLANIFKLADAVGVTASHILARGESIAG